MSITQTVEVPAQKAMDGWMSFGSNPPVELSDNDMVSLETIN